MARFIICDDSYFQQTVLRDKIKLFGYESAVVANGDQLFKLLEKDSDFNGIILDLLMPGMSGMEILKKVKLEYPNLHVVIHSADIQEKRKEEGLSLGASGFLNKPARDKDLNEILSKMI